MLPLSLLLLLLLLLLSPTGPELDFLSTSVGKRDGPFQLSPPFVSARRRPRLPISSRFGRDDTERLDIRGVAVDIDTDDTTVVPIEGRAMG